MQMEERAIGYATKGLARRRQDTYGVRVELLFAAPDTGNWRAFKGTLDFESGDWDMACFRIRSSIPEINCDTLRYDLNGGGWWVTGAQALASHRCAGNIQFFV